MRLVGYDFTSGGKGSDRKPVSALSIFIAPVVAPKQDTLPLKPLDARPPPPPPRMSPPPAVKEPPRPPPYVRSPRPPAGAVPPRPVRQPPPPVGGCQALLACSLSIDSCAALHCDATRTFSAFSVAGRPGWLPWLPWSPFVKRFECNAGIPH